jgi:two-component system chemotaxis sensor kinase CheA
MQMSLDAVSAIVERLAEQVMLADPGNATPDEVVEASLRALEAQLESPDLPDQVRTDIVACVEFGRVFVASGSDAGPDGASGLAAALVKLQSVLIRAERSQALPELRFQGGGESAIGRTGSAEPSAPKPFARDAETIALIGEFLSESEEGLGRADQILMNAEHDGVNAESINSLFRVFHSIKGVSGFLELAEVTLLAHSTESMLDRCREGAVILAGARLDLVFDATAIIGRMLAELKRAVEASVTFISREPITDLVEQLKAAAEGNWVPEATLPFVASGARLGEVITQAPLSVAPEAVEKALEIQQEEGNKLGETLLEMGAASPKQVAQAPRAQQRADNAAPAPSAESAKIRETIKVDIERIDSLVEMIGELVVVEAMVVGAPEIAGTASARVRNCLAQLDKVTRDLQDVGMRMRMLSVAGEFQKMARMSRDLGRKAGKHVRMILAGESTEMDRSMVEQISAPLVHMIRNSIDHGLETPEERRAAGKPEEGTVRLSAYHEGGSVVIEIADDGRGLDTDAILAKAKAQHLIGAGDTLTEAEAHALIFAPGFSTAKQVTEISGRGVGMDVVRRNIEAMRGRISIQTVKGQGTTFRLMLPLTLAIINGMLVACGDERYIIPTLSILESIQPTPAMLATMAGSNEMINVRGEILPLVRLDRLFQVRNAKQSPTESLVVILEGAGRKLGLVVDEVITQQQVVIKNLSNGFSEVKYLSGAAILSDGSVGLIMNVEEIAGTLADRRHRSVREDKASATAPDGAQAIEEETRP